MNTSLEAYEAIKPKIPTDHNLILSVLDKKKGYTYKEIGQRVYKKLLLNPNPNEKLKAYAWKYDPNKVSRRLKELVSLERIKKDSVRKCSLAKSNCTTYILA